MTGSTNDDAKQAALAGCADRTVFLADEQRSGRGRLGRRWVAPPKTSLLFSVVLRRPFPPVLLTAACSVSVAAAVQATTGLPARIKWPNDVMVRDRKVSGVLTEVVSPDRLQATIVGIGLNVNVDPVSAGLPGTATSLSVQLGQPVLREVVLRAILERLDVYLSLDDASLSGRVYREWEALLWRRQQKVQIDRGGTVIQGIVEGLAPSGALRIRVGRGRFLELTVGDVLV